VTVWVDIDFNVPNAFTPNDDGLNDEFNIQTEMLISYYIAIYNRWGDLVFTSDDINEGWNGTLNGVLQEIGTYMYVIESVTTMNTPITKTGTLTLLR
jgi:gliding motility-associated-like protein